MELTNDQKATIEYFRKHPGKLVDGRDGSNHGDDLYTIISSVLDYASAESGKEVITVVRSVPAVNQLSWMFTEVLDCRFLIIC